MDTVPVTVMVKFFYSFNLDERAKLRLVNKQFKESIEYGLKMIKYIDLNPLKSSRSSRKSVCLPSRKISVGKSLYSFLAKYCGDSIELTSFSSFYLEDLIPIASKLKEVFPDLLYKTPNWQNTLKQFTKLERIDSDADIANSICNCILAKQRIDAGKKVHHLILPCYQSFQSWHKDILISRGIKSLKIDSCFARRVNYFSNNY